MNHIQKNQPQRDLTLKPVKFEMEFGFLQFFASLLVLGMFFVLPVVVVNNWGEISKSVSAAFDISGKNGGTAGVAGKAAGAANAATGQVAAAYTDNSGRYINIPIVNFAFDTTLREPSTISFLFGAILLVLSLIIILILFADFKKKENKYRVN
jgi:hypothetical protein